MKSKKKIKNRDESQYDPSDGCCGPDSSTTGRSFLKTTAVGVSALSFSFRSFAGPFEFDAEDHLIPADKRLSAEWIRSLYERGELKFLQPKRIS